MSKCGCEYGGDCTSISVCTAEAMVEDAVEELQRKHSELVNLCRNYPTHGFDRNGSHSADTYVCDCGYPIDFKDCEDADLAWYKKLKALLEQEVRDE